MDDRLSHIHAAQSIDWFSMGAKSFTICVLTAVFLCGARGQDRDITPHKTRFITVDTNVRLEVLDWGGSGRPLVLVTGLGVTAHYFDEFALKLASSYHVYGITRRGFGKSSAPQPTETTYTADRLGDDVIAVIDALKLNQPVLVGHSVGGEELSSVGSRHPEKVAGLVYLDAGYGYAFYDPDVGWPNIDLAELRKKLELLQPGKGPNDTRPLINELLNVLLPRFEKDLKKDSVYEDALPPSMLEGASTSVPPISQAIMAGGQKYTKIPVPILAIFAVPHDMGPAIDNDPLLRAKFDAQDIARVGAQASAFEKGLPTARVVRLPHAKHFVFQSNEAEVLREIAAFTNSLP
jgi:pimeloyl-ACP methyl ester carboxylesterase